MFNVNVWMREKKAHINTHAVSFNSPVSFIDHELGSRDMDALNFAQLRHLLSESRRGHWNRHRSGARPLLQPLLPLLHQH